MIRTVWVTTLGLIALLTFLHVWASTPIVYRSYATGNCVEVIGRNYSCENMPTKYIQEWRK